MAVSHEEDNAGNTPTSTPHPPPGMSELGYQDSKTIKRQSMVNRNESSQEPPFPPPPPSLFSLSANQYTSLLASRRTNTGA